MPGQGLWRYGRGLFSLYFSDERQLAAHKDRLRDASHYNNALYSEASNRAASAAHPLSNPQPNHVLMIIGGTCFSASHLSRLGFGKVGLAAASRPEYNGAMDIAKISGNQKMDATSPDVIVRGNAREFLQEVVAGKHHLRADEPVSYGGGDAAPGPYDYLLVALGVCTSMTIGYYARRKQIPLETITVSLRHDRIHAKDCEECETKEGMLDRIDLQVELTGSFTPDQRAQLMAVAAKCPVHRTLKSEIDIRLNQGAAV